MAVSELNIGALERPAADRGDKGKARVLHVLDHSLPVLSGYAVRSRGLVTGQARLGQPIAVLTGPLHQIDDADACELTVDNVTYFRTPIPRGY